MLNLQLISRFLEFLQGQGERCESENPSKIGKTLGMLLKCLLVSSFKVKNMGMTAKTAELKPIQHCGKTNMKTSTKQIEKGWGLHFSAVLSSAHSATNANVS